jgi:hypothetical protein
MNPPDAAPDGPLDAADLAILDGIREMFERADPMPADLPERIRFSLAMRDLDAEVARLVEEADAQLAGARSAEESRTITFDSQSLTIMIRIEPNTDGTSRVDGWLAPPQRRDLEMRTGASALQAVSDEQGRFAFPSIQRGSVQLFVRPTDDGPAGRLPSVITPALIL